MPYSLSERFKNAWNAFTSRDPTYENRVVYGNSYIPEPTYRSTFYGDNDIIMQIENRIAVDAAQVNIRHVRLDDNKNFKEELDTGLNRALSVSANIDQSGRAFIQDVVMSMFDEGKVAIVPVDTDVDPKYTEGYDILSLRTGRILDFYPDHVRVECFNDRKGYREPVVLPKKSVAIVENPFYSIMNAPNSTLKRLLRTFKHLDLYNDSMASGKMDLIIQLPYSLNIPGKKKEGEARLRDIERQLSGSRYGITYIDAAEKVTQLNRPVENNLWAEAKELTNLLFNQLGLPQSVIDGTADEKVMNNYYTRTVEPILAAITEEMARKFISKTARTQHQAIIYIRDTFKFVTTTDIANTGGALITNRIMNSNEVRAKLGLPPDDSPQANELVNPNIDKVSDTQAPQPKQDFQNEANEQDDEEDTA